MVSGGFHRDGLVSEQPSEDPDAPIPDLAAAYAEVSPEGAEHFRVPSRRRWSSTAGNRRCPKRS